MKNFLLVIFSGVCIITNVHAQRNPLPNFDGIVNTKIYLDSVQTELAYFYQDPNQVKSLNVIPKTFDTATNLIVRKVFFTSKDPYFYHLLSYSYLKENYFANTPKPILLLINGQFVQNYSTVNIDSAYIYKIEVESGDDYNELKNAYSKYAIVSIKTKTDFNLKNQRLINMQGLPKKMLPE